jgi:hypothetical protein
MRGSINLELDDFDEEYIDQATSSTCPECNFEVYHQSLIVREDGVWEMRSPSAYHSLQPTPQSAAIAFELVLQGTGLFM